MKKYNHKKIESKWQEWWEKDKVSKIDKDDQTKEKYYILDMFPYPSGEGLHLGHTESYAASDVFYRYKKMRGYNVLHPQGFDSFGLPTENYAIKTGIPPVKTTKKNIETYTKQMKLLGLAYDFDEKIDTSEPEYYKWTQWLFGEFYKNGLVYKKTSPINWCPSCQTGIANEQVLAGNCERCGAEIIQKEIPGWFFKITDFADDLINDLDKVDWPEHTKKNQINWIGKSEGAIIKFQISHPNGRSPVKGDNFQFPNEQKPNVIIVHGSNFKDNERRNEKDFVPQNERSWLPWTKKELEKKGIKTDIPLMPENWNPKYNQWKKEFEKLEINENSILIGHSLGTNFLVRWLGETNTKIKKLILVALVTGQETCNEWLNDFENFKTDYKIKNNIREIIIFVSDNDNDERLESARIYQKELGAELIELKGRGHFIEKHMGTKEFPELLDKILCSSASGLRESAVNTESIEVFTTRPDTLFGATYMVLAPEHKLIGELKESNLPAGRQVENWEEVEKYIKETQKKTEMERIEGKEKTGVEIKGIKAINPVNKEEIPIFIADYVLEGYGTGAIMAVPAHDTRDYEFADTFGLEIREVVKGGNIQILSTARTKKGDVEIFCEKGILVNSEKFDGMSSEEAKQKITEFARGKSASNYRLRDWSISRQRYWGCPIPIVYSPEGEANLIPGKYLPWKLPEDVDFVPTGKSPLAKSAELKKRTEEIFGKGWAPEYDTMDTFVDSSWYFLRYPDVHNSKEFCSEARQKHWLPVDLYIGGAEHTYMHLLFARFFVKAMKKIGLLDFGEPFLKLRHQGMVLDAQGRKMSKSKGNVINPDKLVEKFGADAVRIQILFAAPLADDIIWNEDNIVGVYRFLEKVWEIGAAGKNESSAAVKNILQKTIKKVGQDIENLKYNTAISEMMKFINAAKKSKISKADFEMFLKILAPFAPHLTEEIWENLGHKISIHLEKWPDYDEKLIKDKTHTIAVQINGKIRAEIEIEDGLSDEEVKEMALSDKRVQKWMDGKSSKKIIYVKNKILSIVV